MEIDFLSKDIRTAGPSNLLLYSPEDSTGMDKSFYLGVPAKEEGGYLPIRVVMLFGIFVLWFVIGIGSLVPDE